MRRVDRVLAAAFIVLVTSAPLNAAQWVRVETPNFVVFGEVGEKRTRDVAAEFERFREALGRVLAGAATRAPVPTTVVVFDSSKSFAPYRPRYNGKAVELAGMFSSERDINRVALALEDREEGLRTIFHEYVHLVVSNVTSGMPIWLNEGLAEYYSTFLVTDDGKTATMGRVIVPHLLLLNQERLLPLQDLLAITHDSPMYNEGQRRGMVYAESWVLVHFLLSDPNRSKQLGEYTRVTGAGTPAAAAWQQVFGAYDPLPDLKRYAQQASVLAYRYHFTEGIETIKGDAVRLTDAEIDATLGDELLGVGRREDAEALLKKAATMQPPSSRAKALLGLERVNDGRYDEARKLLMEAAGDRDWLTQYYVAAGLANMIQSDHEDAVFATGEVASRAMEAVLAVRPELPHILALQGLVAMATQKNVDAAALAVRRGRTLAPGREDYAFLEASLHMMRRDYGSAREILAPMMSGRYSEAVRERARTLMGKAVRLEQREHDYATRRTEAAVPADGTQAGPPAGAPATNDPPMRVTYRPIEPGEQRTEGLLERIACLAQGALLEVRVDGALLKFFVARLDQMDFISYRPSLTGAVSCGTRTPADHVYVTWREPPAAAADVKGRAVAVEFLPK